jgi:multisubunit Na+/H+ antiporter MnhG subunit
MNDIAFLALIFMLMFAGPISAVIVAKAAEIAERAEAMRAKRKADTESNDD